MNKSMSHNQKLVIDFIDAFNGNDIVQIMLYIHEDAFYHNIPMDPLNGANEIKAMLAEFMHPVEEVNWSLLHIAETGEGVVLTERLDRFLISGKWIVLPVMGAFEIEGNKIKSWRDYFDLGQLQSQMPDKQV